MESVKSRTTYWTRIFVDLTSSCDTQNHCLTFLLTPCAVGAAPLGFYTETFDVEMLQPSPPRYSSISTLIRYNEDDPSQSRSADEETGLREYLVTNLINPLEIAWTPIRKTIPRTIHAVDENDGPTYFNRP
ncbi:Uncharacterized protein FWK35_00028494 [Aphis craccivora]|uniref:Uncharacterized protein n=1 Tax=Aphis craccivora TaxID=307492 RepID=A0A6G0VWI5_APHCR|nr:Uncharacterized protein FWK35_00028494 [Aphis craccivora]